MVLAVLLYAAPPIKGASAGASQDPEAIFNRGTALYYGMAGTPDRKAGCQLFGEAAELDYPAAVFSLANCIRQGDFGDADLEMAEGLYLKAASLGVADAYSSLGAMHLQRDLPEASDSAANQFFRIALFIDPENQTAALHYGLSLILGRVVRKDIERGLELLEVSHNSGNSLAIAALYGMRCERNDSNAVCKQYQLDFDTLRKVGGSEEPTLEQTVAYLRHKNWLPE